MDSVLEWNICRVCLQENESEMLSLFEMITDEQDIASQIMICSSIKIQKGVSLPDVICNNCFDDLNVAYKFHKKCEESNKILQSIVMSTEIEENRSENPIVSNSILKIKVDDINDEIEDDILDDDTNTNISVHEETVKIETIDDEEDDEEELSQYYEEMEEIHDSEEPTPSGIEAGQQEYEVIYSNENSKRKPSTRRKKPKFEPTPCPICGNVYKQQSVFNSHMRRHLKEKPFACGICAKDFVCRGELKRHMRTHTGEKPYPCKFCSRPFSDFGSRTKHERTHTGERPYGCDVCGKAFATPQVLASHYMIHTNEKKYKCEMCFKLFRRSHHLKTHLKSHENSLRSGINMFPPMPIPETTSTAE